MGEGAQHDENRNKNIEGGCMKNKWKRKDWDIRSTEDDTVIANIIPHDSSEYKKEDNDNANLILAAPLLYEALNHFLTVSLVDRYHYKKYLAEAKRALKVAEGGLR